MTLPFFGLRGSNPDTLVNDIGLEAAYDSVQSAALAELTLTFSTAGTWAFTVGAGDTLGGTPTSGTWLASGAAAEYEILFTPSNLVNSPTVTNGAATYTAMSANRAFKVEKNNADASAECLVSIRRIVNPPRTLTDTTNMAAKGAV